MVKRGGGIEKVGKQNFEGRGGVHKLGRKLWFLDFGLVSLTSCRKFEGLDITKQRGMLVIFIGTAQSNSPLGYLFLKMVYHDCHKREIIKLIIQK